MAGQVWRSPKAPAVDNIQPWTVGCALPDSETTHKDETRPARLRVVKTQTGHWVHMFRLCRNQCSLSSEIAPQQHSAFRRHILARFGRRFQRQETSKKVKATSAAQASWIAKWLASAKQAMSMASPVPIRQTRLCVFVCVGGL